MPAYTSKERLATVHSPIGEDALLLSHMTGHECLSQLFRYEVELLSELREIDPKDIVGKNVTIALTLAGGKERYFNGIVSRLGIGATHGRFAAYSAEIMPWLWFLTRTADCRIFQGKSPSDIIEQIFGEYGLSDFENLASGDAIKAAKDYVVQYRETDFNFISRLMEEGGVSYFFKHTDKGHTCVLFDKPSDNPTCPNQATARYSLTTHGRGASLGDIESWEIEHELQPGSYSFRDFDPLDPGKNLEASSSTTIKIGGNEKYEVYDYPGEYAKLGEGEKVSQLRMEALEAASVIARGASGCADFSPGYKFSLTGHPSEKMNDSYLVHEVTHHLSQDIGSDTDTGSRYHNEIACIPHATPFRPLQDTPKPVISGVQTATVVGPSGEEIYTDEHGRVKVQFHWDREGKRDETSSCWIRVSQNWAGKQWGAFFLPRIGQEVIVDFLEGDPDRPIVVGRVYNGEQKPPYALPAEKTKSTIKTRSTKGGDGETFNEIRFEDKKGSEEFYVHAEKDRKKVVENDEDEDVGHDRIRHVANDETITIDNDRKRHVGNDETVKVVGMRRDEVGKNEERSVGEDRKRTVGGEESVVISKDQSINVEATRNLVVEKDQNTKISGSHAIDVGDSQNISVKNDYEHTARTITLEATNEIVIRTGSASITMKKNGDITMKGKKIQIKGSGDVIVKGAKIAEN